MFFTIYLTSSYTATCLENSNVYVDLYNVKQLQKELVDDTIEGVICVVERRKMTVDLEHFVTRYANYIRGLTTIDPAGRPSMGEVCGFLEELCSSRVIPPN